MNGLTKGERLRRVVLLCRYFAKNLAYYRAVHSRLTAGKYSQILVTIDGNFIDMAVIEWCKLFGDKNGKHFWSNVVASQDFEAEMLKQINQSPDQFSDYIRVMRSYRDKFLAHLDDEKVMNIPILDHALSAVEFYHNYVVSHEAAEGDLAHFPPDLRQYYQQCFKEGLATLGRCKL